ncbi:MAG: PilZ domain-containing protein [Pseudomonadota bacterium]
MAFALGTFGAQSVHALCAQAVAVEEMIASHDPQALMDREELKRLWSQLADQLARTAPPDDHASAQHKLVFGLRAGLPEEAHAAILNLQAAMPECFGLSDRIAPEALDLVTLQESDAAPREPQAAADEMPITEPANGSRWAREALAFEWEEALISSRSGLALALMAAGGAIAVAGASLLSRQSRWRHATRYTCSVPADIVAPESDGKGRLTNISIYGAQVQRLAFDARTGDQVHIATPVLEATAEVMWVNTHFIGVRFQAPIDPYTVSTAIKFREI